MRTNLYKMWGYIVIGVDDCLHESYAMMNASIEVIEPHDFVIYMMVIICAFQNRMMAFTSILLELVIGT